MGSKRRPNHRYLTYHLWRGLLAAGILTCIAVWSSSILTTMDKPTDNKIDVQGHFKAHACPKPCLDVLVPYHEADEFTFVQSGGLFSATKHLQDVRYIYVVSVSNKTFEHMLSDRIRWYDEAKIPFYNKRVDGKVSGWKYQQALKLWAVRHIPGLCNNVFVLDADVVWMQDFEVIVLTFPEASGLCPPSKFKYNIATAVSGAWESDIYSEDYHSFIEYFTGLPKMDANALTAINHWQVMQRDVLEALDRSLLARTHRTMEDAILQYGEQGRYDMTEYEAYFSFVSYFYPERAETITLPYVIRQPRHCNYFDNSVVLLNDSGISYLTCHDRYDREDFYVNCNGKNCKTSSS